MKLFFSSPPKNSRGEQIPLIVGDFVTVCFEGAKEVSVITLRIVEKMMAESGITLALAETGQAEELQRRQHYRFSTIDEMQKTANPTERFKKIAITAFETSDLEMQHPLQAGLVNISAGGALFAFGDTIPHLNAIMNLRIEIPGLTAFTAMGKIARIERREHDGKFAFMAAVSFIDIDEGARSRILGFIEEEKLRTQEKPQGDLNLRG